jgi:hypothetical protein
METLTEGVHQFKLEMNILVYLIMLLGWHISSERFFSSPTKDGAHKVELLVHSGIDAEFYGESFDNKI